MAVERVGSISVKVRRPKRGLIVRPGSIGPSIGIKG